MHRLLTNTPWIGYQKLFTCCTCPASCVTNAGSCCGGAPHKQANPEPYCCCRC